MTILTGFETVSPSGWGLANQVPHSDAVTATLGLAYRDVVLRCRQAVYSFLDGLYNPDVGALHHYYRADTDYTSEIDSGNYLMTLNFLVMFDLFADDAMLERAISCFRYSVEHFTETHPMFFWQGGVRDGFRPREVWVKYTGDAFWAALALYRRTKDEAFMQEIYKFHNFFKRAREAGFRYTFDTELYTWKDTGNVWRAFGFPVTAYCELYEQTGDAAYLEHALAWGDHGLSLQAEDGAFHLLDGRFWNSDLVAPELRGLVYLWELTREAKYRDAATRFADWLLTVQRPDGSWPLGIDLDGEVCVHTVGPGDMPNIAISLIRLHAATQHHPYLQSAVRAVRYGMSMQACEGGAYPLHLDNPRVKWGFWSWDPLYDYSLSGDQSVHHIRGMLFLASYLGSM